MPDITEKQCYRCKVVKPISSFQRSTQQGGWNRWCTECRKTASVISKYGEDVYSKFFDLQNGVCAICGRAEWVVAVQNKTKEPDRLCIDHDHATGVPRGLLCRSCNWLLGRVGDNLDWMIAAIEYLSGGESDS